MTKKKSASIALAVIAILCLAAGIYFACTRAVFAQTGNNVKEGTNLTLQTLGSDDQKLSGIYLEAYGIPNSIIKSFESDSETEAGLSFGSLFDRNFKTVWRASEYVSETKSSVSVTIYFNDPYKLDGFIYQAESNGRGYFSDLNVYYHDRYQVDNDEFKLYGSLNSSHTGSAVYVKFKEPTEMTAIRLEWKGAPKFSGRQVVGGAELVLMQPEDTDINNLTEMYSDYAYLQLDNDVTEQKVTQLRATLEKKTSAIATWSTFVEPFLNRATQILNKGLLVDPLREMSTDPDARNVLLRVGDVAGYARHNLRFTSFGTNRQATGILVKPGDTLVVYVEADDGDPLPSIVTTQHWGSYSLWTSGQIPLQRGRNVIKPQNLYTYAFKDNLGDAVPAGGPIYLVNPYLPKENEGKDEQEGTRQSKNVKIYFEGGTTFPIFRMGDEEDAYKSFLQEYAARVEEDKLENVETASYSVVDVTEVVSQHIFVTVQASMANRLYNDEGYSPQQACEQWDDYVTKLLMFDGIVFKDEGETSSSKSFTDKLADVNAQYDPRNEWLNCNVRLMQPFGAAYAGGEHIGIQVDWEGGAITGGPNFGWGYSHEIGHELDIAERLVGECSNNMISKFDETVLLKTATRGNFAENTATLAPDDHIPTYWNTNRGNFTFWWLIESYFPGYWPRMENLYRYEDLYQYVKEERIGNVNLNATEKQIYLCSLATGLDLSYYFERWGYNLAVNDKVFKQSEATELFKLMMQRAKQNGRIKDDTSKPKLWYLDAAEWWVRYSGENNGKLYSPDDASPEIMNITKTANGYSIIIGEDNSGKYDSPNHLGYEVQVKTGSEWKVVGFTYGRIFSDSTTYAGGVNPRYRVVAYDRALQCAKEGNEKSYSSTAITQVCKNEKTNAVYNSVDEAVKAANDGDTIILLKNTYESGIIINKNITIKTDNQSVTITKSGADPIFTVIEETIMVEREGEEGEFEEVQHLGKLTLIGSAGKELVLDGYGIETDSSLIYVKSGELHLEHCTLRRGYYKWGNNSAGGAVRFDGGVLEAKNTLFEDNSARLGGAVYVIHRDKSTITFTDCTFKGNDAYEGGGLYNTSTITLTGCTFEGNTATNVGGGFANISGGVLTVKDCNFKNNSTEGRGGGFYSDGKVELYGGEITGNSAAIEGGGFAYNRTTGAARYFYCYKSENGDKLTKISDNTCENGSAVLLHGQVDHFEAEISGNKCKYGVRLGGGTVVIDGGSIEGDLFREGSGKVVLKQNPFTKQAITVYTDSAEARILLFSGEGGGNVLSQEFANKFTAENQKSVQFDSSRNEIVIEMESFSVTFNIKVNEEDVRQEMRHYRPATVITLEAFSGDKDRQWYVESWKDETGRAYRVGEKVTVNANVTFTAVIGKKFKIEFKVDDAIDGLQTQTFYATLGDKYTLPKYDIEGYIHNGWQAEDGKVYQPSAVLRAARDRTFTAVIVRKLTVNYWIGAEGLETKKFATKTFGYGSTITGENYEYGEDDPYLSWPGFIDGFYILYSDGNHSKETIDFQTYILTSDLDLIAKVVEDASTIIYTIYDDYSVEILATEYSYVAYGTQYTTNLLPIPTGYHLTSLSLNYETVDPADINGFTFEVTEYMYFFIAYVDKDVLNINYQCNDVHFRTDTIKYGSTYTFTDPTNSLLKEAVRKFHKEDGSVNTGNYYFTSYQIVSPNPKAEEEGESETVKLNVMVGNQLTVTSDLTINIIAYIEGYEYEADDSGDLVESWRNEYRQRVSAYAAQIVADIKSPLLNLTEDERKGFIDAVNQKEKEINDSISLDVSYDAMDGLRIEFEEYASSQLAQAKLRAERNDAIAAIKAAQKDALTVLESKEGDEIANAKKEIEQIVTSAVQNIETATSNDDFSRHVQHAKDQIQAVVEKYDGDSLALQKNNAISSITGVAENTKKEINMFAYLSAAKKEWYGKEIDGMLQTTINEINGVTLTAIPLRGILRGQRISAMQEIENIKLRFTALMTTERGFAEAQDAAKARQIELLRSYAATTADKIRQKLASVSAEICSDGIIVANTELIAAFTTFADEKAAEVDGILQTAIPAIIDVFEDSYLSSESASHTKIINELVTTAKADMDARFTAVEEDFAKKMSAAENQAREELISLHITAVADEALSRLTALTLADLQSYASRIETACTAAEEGVRTGDDMVMINAAIAEFAAQIAQIKLEAERESALAQITAAVAEAKRQLATYDFLDENWQNTLNSSVAEAAQTATSSVNDAVAAEDVISHYGIFEEAVEGVYGRAAQQNSIKGEEARAAAVAAVETSAAQAEAQIDGLTFLEDGDTAKYKSQISSLASGAEEEIIASTTKAKLTEITDRFTQGLSGANGVLTEAQNKNEQIGNAAKSSAKTLAEQQVNDLKQKIAALPYLSEDGKQVYYTKIDERLQKAYGIFEAAKSLKPIEEEQAALLQALNTTYSAAVESNNAIRGDKVAKAMVAALKEVGDAMEAARAKVEGLNFLSAEQRKYYGDKLSEELNAATAEINGSADESGAAEAAAKHVAIVNSIADEAQSADGAEKTKAVQAANGQMDSAATSANGQINRLQYLDGQQKAEFTNGINSSLATAKSAVQACTRPEEIAARVENFKQSVATELEAANAADVLAKAKADAQNSLSGKDQYLADLAALGFLTPGQTESFRAEIEAAVTKAQGEIAAASSVDGVNMALAAYAASAEGTKKAAAQKNSENESAQKAEYVKKVSEAALNFYATIDEKNYLYGEGKDGYKITVTTLVQQAESEIEAAKDVAGLEAALAKLNAALDELKGEIGNADDEAKEQSSARATQLVEAAALSAKDLSALGFLSAEEMRNFTDRIDRLVNAAKEQIAAATTVEEITAVGQNAPGEIAKVKAEAEEQNLQNAQTAKAKAQTELEQKTTTAQAELAKLGSLTREQAQTFGEQISSAANRGTTGVLDALNPAGISTAIDGADNDFAGILAAARLRNEKNSALEQVKTAAEAAKTEVNGLPGLTQEQKNAYAERIEAELASAKNSIEQAEESGAAQDVLASFNAALDGMKKGAATDSGDKLLANAKEEALAAVQQAAAQAEGAAQNRSFLTAEQAEEYGKATATALATAQGKISSALNTQDVTAAKDEYLAALERAQTAAEQANEQREAQLKEEAKEELAQSLQAAKFTEWKFLGEEGVTEYNNSLDSAHAVAERSITSAKNEEQITSAKQEYYSAENAARATAAAANTQNRLAAVQNAEQQIEGCLATAQESVNGLGFVDSAEYLAQLGGAADTARQSLANADEQADITSAVGALQAELEQITNSAIAANSAAKEAATQKAAQEAAQKAEESRAQLANSGFLAQDNQFGGQITSALATAQSAISSATDQGKINDALAALDEELAAVQQQAAEANAQNRLAAEQSAQSEIENALTAAQAQINGLGFADADQFLAQLDGQATIARQNLANADKQSQVTSAVNDFKSAAEQTVNSAKAADSQAKEQAVQNAAEIAEGYLSAAREGLQSLGFVQDKSTFQTQLTQAYDAACAALPGSTTPAGLSGQIESLLSAIATTVQAAEQANTAARTAAVNTALEQVTELQTQALSALASLSFITEEDYSGVIQSAAQRAQSAITAAQTPADISAALEELQTSLSGIGSRARSANDPARDFLIQSASAELDQKQSAAAAELQGMTNLADSSQYLAQVSGAIQSAKSQLNGAQTAEEIAQVKQQAIDDVEAALAAARAANQPSPEPPPAENPPQPDLTWLWVVLAGVAVVGVAIITVLLVKKRGSGKK